MLKNNKNLLVNRLKRIEGQVRGIRKMVENGKYCVDILIQSLAVENSLESFNARMLENHLNEHVAHQFMRGQTKKAVKELLKIYNLANK